MTPSGVTTGAATTGAVTTGAWVQTRPRSRTAVGIVGVCVVAAGLLVHYTGSGAAADFLADSLYAVMVYLIAAFALRSVRPVAAAGISFGLCALIELVQLTDGPSLLAATFPPARLLFGSTFAPIDLVAYAIGTVVALTSDVLVARPRGRA